MATRVNTAIRRLAKDEPVFCIGSCTGAEPTFEAGVRVADTWADGCPEDSLARKLADGVCVTPGTERPKKTASELQAGRT